MSDTRKINLDDLKIEAWPLDRLKPAPNNHKNHTEESVAKLARSLDDIGQLQAIIVDKECEIIAGHGRLMAARKLGWDKVKVIQVPVDRATAIKARIADNLMSNQDINQEALAIELGEVGEIEGLDLDGLNDVIGATIQDDSFAKLVGMGLQDDFGMSDDAVSADILSDSKTLAEEGERMIEAASGSDVRLQNVFGFAKVTASQARVLKDFMAVVMDERPETDPADALTAWAEEVMG